MKFNKQLLASAVAASVAAAATLPAHADIELGEGLSVTGFVDMSYVYTDNDSDTVSNDKVFGVDQVETDFLYSGKDGVSAQVDIEYGLDEDTGATNTFVEQAFITKDLGNGLSVKGGRFLSYSGWETEEPTGLYQYSAAGYGEYFYGGYQQGVSALYDTDAFDVMFSVVNSISDPNENDTTQLGIEAGLAVTPAEGVTAKLFYIAEGETSLINFWTSYETGPMTFAFEYNIADYGDDLLNGAEDASGFLLMANYALSEKVAVTARFHDYSTENGSDTVMEANAITLAPSYALTDNLLLVAEVRLDEETTGTADADESTSVALEALFTF